MSILASLFMGVCTFYAVTLRHAWGYDAACAILNKPGDDWPLGIFAMLLTVLIISPVAFSLTFGYMKESFNGSRLWNLAFLLVPITFYTFLATSDLFGFDNDLAFAAMFGLVQLSVFCLPKILAETILARLRQINRPWRILGPGLVSIAICGALVFFYPSMGEWGMAIDCGLMFFAALVAAFLCRSTTSGTAITAAVLTVLPTFLFSFCNLAITHFYIMCFEPEILLSNALICSLGIVSVLLGAFTGLCLYRFKSKDQLIA